MKFNLKDKDDFGRALRWLGALCIDLQSKEWTILVEDLDMSGIVIRWLTGTNTLEDFTHMQEALERVCSDQEAWSAYRLGTRNLGIDVDGRELDLLMDRERKIEIFGHDLMTLPAEMRVGLVRSFFTKGMDN